MPARLQADVLKTIVAEKNNVNIDVIAHESIDFTNSWSLQQYKVGKVFTI